MRKSNFGIEVQSLRLLSLNSDIVTLKQIGIFKSQQFNVGKSNFGIEVKRISRGSSIASLQVSRWLAKRNLHDSNPVRNADQ